MRRVFLFVFFAFLLVPTFSSAYAGEVLFQDNATGSPALTTLYTGDTSDWSYSGNYLTPSGSAGSNIILNTSSSSRSTGSYELRFVLSDTGAATSTSQYFALFLTNGTAYASGNNAVAGISTGSCNVGTTVFRWSDSYDCPNSSGEVARSASVANFSFMIDTDLGTVSYWKNGVNLANRTWAGANPDLQYIRLDYGNTFTGVKVTNITLCEDNCDATPYDPNGTLTVQAVSTVDSSVIDGLCAVVSNSTFNISGCNSSGTDVYFGNYLNSSLSVGVYNISVYSAGFGDGVSANYSSNSTLNVNWSTNQTSQVYVTPLSLILNFLDEETRLSLNGTNVSVSVIDSLGNITDYVTSNGSLSIVGVLTEGDYIVRYSAENYSLRDFYFTLSLDDPVTDETLYLLRSSIFTPGNVFVRDFDGLGVSGAEVLMQRYYGNDTIPNRVQWGTTDSNGDVVFVAESVTAFYTFSVFVDDVLRYSEDVPQLLTVDSSGLFSKTIVLPRQGLDVVNQNTGFLFSFSPSGVLVNGSVNNFSVVVNSSSWDLEYCFFGLYNASDSVLLNSTSGFCNSSSGVGSLSYDLVVLDPLYVELVVGSSLFNNSYYRYYSVFDYGNGSFTLSDLADDLSVFDGSGFNNFSRFLISIVAIFLIVGGVTSRSNFINNPEELMLLVFLLSLPFSFIDWLNLGISSMPVPALNQWFISMLLGLLVVVSLIRKMGGSE